MRYAVCKYFLPFDGLYFHSIVSFAQNVLIFIKFIVPIFYFITHAFGVIAKNSLPNLKVMKMYLYIFSKFYSISSHI